MQFPIDILMSLALAKQFLRSKRSLATGLIGLIGLIMGMPLNAWAGPVVVDGNGNVLGLTLNESGYGSTGSFFNVINDKGYRVAFFEYYDNPDNVATLYPGYFEYETDDCSGTPYTTSRSQLSGAVFNGPVGDTPEPLGVWYTSSDEQPVFKQFLSERILSAEWECRPARFSSEPKAASRAYHNDPEITGVSQLEWPAPLQIKHPNDPDVTGCIFNDRFESCR